MPIFLISAGRWLVGSKLGRIVALVGGAMLALLMARRIGYKAAQDAQEKENLEEYRDVRKRVDEAVRASDGDNATERLSKHGAFRD